MNPIKNDFMKPREPRGLIVLYKGEMRDARQLRGLLVQSEARNKKLRVSRQNLIQEKAALQRDAKLANDHIVELEIELDRYRQRYGDIKD